MDRQEQPMDAFEDWLHTTGSEFQYPSTPPLAGRVAARLRSEVPPQRSSRGAYLRGLFRGSRELRGLAVALILAIFALGLATAVSSSTRTALAEFFGLKSIEVVPVVSVVSVEGAPTAHSSPGDPAGFDTVVGSTTLGEARSKAAFPLRLPSYPEEIGQPDAVYFQDLQPGQQVIMVYQVRPGLFLKSEVGDGSLFTLFQFRTEGVFQKLIYSSILIEELEVSGVKALWFQGSAHFLQFRDPGGNVELKFKRLVEGNTLAWEVEDITYRLETSLSREDAVKIAASLR